MQTLVTEGYLKPLRAAYPHAKVSLQPRHDGSLYQRAVASLLQAGQDAAMLRSGGFLGQAMEILSSGEARSPQTGAFVEAFSAGSSLALTQVLAPMEKMKRDQLQDILSQWLDVLEGALAARSGMTAVSAQSRQLSATRSSQELLDAIRHIKKASAYAQGNVSPAAICGWLMWALR